MIYLTLFSVFFFITDSYRNHRYFLFYQYAISYHGTPTCFIYHSHDLFIDIYQKPFIQIYVYDMKKKLKQDICVMEESV